MNLLEHCTLCPRRCGVNRLSGKTGLCGSSDEIKIARAALHPWEEPCISGEKGSGTVFFSHCTLKCVYCQNYSISTQNKGRTVSENELAEIFLSLQNDGASNINLVTPTHYVPQIISALDIARCNGLSLPIVYNSGGYETVETIDLLNGYIDIYLPDIKYYDDKYAVKYSNAENYFKTAIVAVDRMVSQVGACKFDKNGIIKSGVIIRHLVLPGMIFDSRKILTEVHKKFGNDVFISIMSQYTPLPTLPNEFPELNRKIKMKLYNSLLNYASGIGITNAYIQEGESADESFIPDFFDE